MSYPAYPRKLVPQGLDWTLVSNTQVFRSPLTGSAQTTELPGARWTGNLTFPAWSREKAQQLAAFLFAQAGQAGRFWLPMWGQIYPIGAARVLPGAPTVSGPNQTGKTLICAGAPPNVPRWLKAGDYVQIGNDDRAELKIVTDDIGTAADGTFLLKFAPPLRRSPPNAAPIITAYPSALVMLSDPKTAASYKVGQRMEFTVGVEEAFQ